LPFAGRDEVDWDGFDAHLQLTFDVGLTPAVNMDTGYANLIDDSTREEVLKRTEAIGGGRPFVAGVFVGDRAGASLNLNGYLSGLAQIVAHGGTPIIFQSHGLIEQDDQGITDAYESFAAECDSLLFFELAKVFAPFGKIYSLDVYQQLMTIPTIVGAKHSSLRRELEWQRLQLRDQVRPEFKVFTGNDLAIDMVMYGSDYLLGLSTFAPEAFARRDQLWASGDPRFYELNDLLQYLGTFTFRNPTPAYKHSAAQFLKLRGRLTTDLTHPKSPRRPDSDLAVLQWIASDLDRLMSESA
jgi:dihydrodipicolinate synthase/N-acetylneuraminate lyase